MAWLGVFAANLILPLVLGSDVTRHGGAIGMWLGVAVIGLAGHLAVARTRELRACLVIGGVFTAAAQLLPVMHFFAGLVSLVVVHRVSGGPLNELGGFVATLLTGGQLILVAVVVGAVIRSVFVRPAT